MQALLVGYTKLFFVFKGWCKFDRGVQGYYYKTIKELSTTLNNSLATDTNMSQSSPRSLPKNLPWRGIPGFPMTPPTAGDIVEYLDRTGVAECCEDLVFLLACASIEHEDDVPEKIGIELVTEHIISRGGGEEGVDAFFSFLSAFKSNKGGSGPARRASKLEYENRELRKKVADLEDKMKEADQGDDSEFEDCLSIDPDSPVRNTSGKPPHGIPRGSRKNPVGSFWIMKNDDTIHGIGRGTGDWKGKHVREYCPNYRKVAEDGTKMWKCICECEPR